MDIKRLTSALLGFPLVVLILTFGNKYVVDIFLMIVAMLGMQEYFNAVAKESKPVRWVGYLSCIAIALVHILPENVPEQTNKMILLIAIPLINLILFAHVIITNMKINFKDIAYTLFGIIYVIGNILFIALLRGAEHGIILVWYAIIAAWGTDIFAYLIGKGTQAKQIADKYHIPHISTGDIFRANIKNGTELGNKAKQYMDQGLLVPDELTCDLVMDRIKQDDCENGFVLDGFPRTIPQAEALTAALEKINEKMDYAIDVDVPDENIVNRMSGRRACLNCGATYHIVSIPTKVEGICDRCGQPVVLRDDDKPETVQKRLTVYHEQTQPLIDYYKKQSILKTVDGTQPMEKVFADIVAILGE